MDTHPVMEQGRGAPRATYRLQFHRGFTLRQATALVPYLEALGISHVYASPLLKARPGSTHGYDVCDFSQLNPEIGTESDLEAFAAALRERGLGLVLDLVPNHMGIGADNPWWWDVLQHGRASRFAGYFDIDWESPDPQLTGKVLLPVLGDEYERVLECGELKVDLERDTAVVRYFEHRFPLAPASVPAPGRLAELNGNPGELDRLLQQQHYRLACWRRGDAEVNYRRFFNITTLAGIRVEDETVFRDVHARVLDWYRRGLIDGLRIDHPDGLRDPQQYLERLRQAAPGTWVVVEKILEPGEDLPADWPVAGTTGYDFLNRAGGLSVDPAGAKPLTDFYAGFTGEPAGYAAVVHEKKAYILRHLLVAEVNRLVRLLERIAKHRGRQFAPDDLRAALIELVAGFPVYRTYVQAEAGRIRDTDEACIRKVIVAARRRCAALEPALFDFFGDVLLLYLRSDRANEFVMRFQQLSGPAMAKGVEDTTYYCFNRFIALNEVGGDPGHFGLSVEEFHQSCLQAQTHWPESMLAGSTHDTKRSEDVRARLSLISEIPSDWTAAVLRWSALNEKHRRNGLPDRNAEYLFYQTLVGAWPLALERALAFMEKASREAKQHTSWTDPNAAYDNALRHFVSATLQDNEFGADLERFVAPLVDPGRVTALAQTLLRLTAPGVPDIYQGNELWDLSLVDPDNRRPVDFGVRQAFLAEMERLSPEQVWERRDEGLPKLWLIRKTLDLRRRHPDWFGAGAAYAPVTAHGLQARCVVAYRRGNEAITVVPRLVLGVRGNWGDTTIEVPPGDWRDVLGGQTVPGGSRRVADLFRRFPVALLARPTPKP